MDLSQVLHVTKQHIRKCNIIMMGSVDRTQTCSSRANAFASKCSISDSISALRSLRIGRTSDVLNHALIDGLIKESILCTCSSFKSFLLEYARSNTRTRFTRYHHTVQLEPTIKSLWYRVPYLVSLA